MSADCHLVGLYPELAAGGFSRVDGTVAFYVRVNALLAGMAPPVKVLDFGAGRGSFFDDHVPFRRDLRLLRGKAAEVIGVDVDDAVLGNPSLDHSHVVTVGGQLPLVDSTVDLIVADFVFEHVTDPAWVCGELDRVMRPGGWLCARTPNRHGYIGLGARFVPNGMHDSLLRRLQPTKQERDTFPTAYRLNTGADLRRWFPERRFDHVVWAADSEPRYVGRSVFAARANKVAFALTPPRWRSILYAYLRKRSVARPESPPP